MLSFGQSLFVNLSRHELGIINTSSLLRVFGDASFVEDTLYLFGIISHGSFSCLKLFFIIAFLEAVVDWYANKESRHGGHNDLGEGAHFQTLV